jgi:predicted SAM-dependent methyltransferase
MNLSSKRLFTSHRENTVNSIRFYFSSVSKSHFLPGLSRFINKYLYKFGIGSAINRYDNSFTLYSSIADKSLYKGFQKDEKFLNFGSGAFFHNKWINYDYPGQSAYYKCLQGLNGKDFQPIDLCSESLQIPEYDESISLIYCSHTLEHLTKESCDRFLSECFRILKKDGVLRVSLPNMKDHFYLTKCLLSQKNINNQLQENYLRDSAAQVLADTRDINIEELLSRFSSVEFDSQAFYKQIIDNYPEYKIFDGKNPERHINYLDFEILIDTASSVGFSCVIPSYQGSSVARPFTNLHVFDSSEPHIAVYADIIK